MQKRDPRPEIQRLEELAFAVKTGDVKLPKFQRPFVWRKSDVLKLLDSIYKGYPIGSLLMWNSSQQLTSERSILGLEISSNEQVNYPTNYLLDGQQRLTALCGALFWDGKDESSQWNISFDLNLEEFTHHKDGNVDALFPLSKLIDTRDFIRQCMAYERHVDGPRYIKTAEKLLRAVKDYKIAVVKIGDMTVEEVAPIFERINSTGRKLTIVDLMVAATWKNGFDLNDVMSEISKEIIEMNFGDIKDQIILRSISAAAGGGINKEDIQKLRKLDAVNLSDASRSVTIACARAIRFFNSRFSVRDFSKIPYAIQFTYVVEFFRILDSEDEILENELTKWIWYTSFTRYFSSASTSGQVSKDLGNIRRFVNQRSGNLYRRDQVDLTRLFSDKFNLRTSTSGAFAMILGHNMPLVSIDGESINDSYLYVKDSRMYSAINKSANLNIDQVINFGSKINLNFSSQALPAHFLNGNIVENFKKGDLIAARAERAKMIAFRIKEIIECDVIWSDFTSPLDAERDAGYFYDDVNSIDDLD
ncbi:hypothetical protein FHT05_002288 [Xanthomonas arboricola]|uniref:DUF262 domain-containing protein n=1 Tax=Xanthomonas arboricola TaxID=56448 RepID=UPI0016203C92|nr:DUF262 domain-containing protein [Xanthomonas arboricola]MBB6257704.1 hypothetical protein [Xanthomonas arboricola]